MVPRAQFRFAECIFAKHVCAVSEMGPIWVPPQLAKGGWLGPVQTMPFAAKSAFSTKENTFGIGFRPRIPPAKQQSPRSQRQPRPSLALWEQRAR